MPVSLNRNDYYWINNRLTVQPVQRTNKHARWPTPSPIESHIASIISHPDGQEVQPGVAATPMKLAYAMLRDQGINTAPDTPDLGASIPIELLNDMRSELDQQMVGLTRRFGVFANEERQTGGLMDRLTGFVKESEDWSVTVFVQGFSSVKKEPSIGADLGITTQLKTSQGSVIKGALAQAKRVIYHPKTTESIPGLSDQVDKMERHTPEAYTVLYTPEQVTIFQGHEADNHFSVGSLLADMARCARGDRDPRTIANARHHEIVIDAFLTQRNMAPKRYIR